MDNAVLGIMGVALGFFFVYVAIIIFYLVCVCKCYVKAGVEWWKAIIPVYNTYIQGCIGGTKYITITGLILVAVAQVASIFSASFILGVIYVFAVLMLFISYCAFIRSFGCGVGMIILCFFIPIVGLPILAFSSSIQYVGPNTNEPTVIKWENKLANLYGHGN